VKKDSQLHKDSLDDLEKNLKPVTDLSLPGLKKFKLLFLLGVWLEIVAPA
jgi:hypothetical protein